MGGRSKCLSYVGAFFIMALIAISVYGILTSSIRMMEENIKRDWGNPDVVYRNLNDMIQKSGIGITCPKYVREQKNIVYMGYNDNTIEIINDTIDFKASYFVSDLDNLFDLEGGCDIDCRYTLKNGSEYDKNRILFVRYRTGFDSMYNKAVLNWNDGHIQYALLVKDDGLIDSINKIGIDLSDYEKVGE